MNQNFVTTGPAAEPLSLDEAKLHLRISSDDTSDDGYIASLIKAARQRVELATSRALCTQSFKLVLPAFPAARCEWVEQHIVLPVAPVQAVQAITWTDTLGQSQTWDAANWRLIAGEPALIELAYGAYWPFAIRQSDAVAITYTAGFGDATAVPELAKAAMRLMIGSLYENRTEVVTSTLNQPFEMPRGVQSLLGLLSWGAYR